MRRAVIAALLTAVSAGSALAAAGDVPLADPALEARAQALGREIRCVVCENEPVALSQAEIAIDMRQAIRARLAAGDSDRQVRDYFASRYGDFVLLRPRVGAETLALWGAPLLLLLVGGGVLLAGALRGRGTVLDPALAEETDTAKAALERHRSRGG
jgi:cytochrome c-type biogenesis protein CcmH